jgi:hypothetical protein
LASALAAAGTEGRERPVAHKAVVVAHLQTAQTALETWVALVALVLPLPSPEPHTVAAAGARPTIPARWRLEVLVVGAAEATTRQETSAWPVAHRLAGAAAEVLAQMLQATVAAVSSLSSTMLDCGFPLGLGL